jgi:hypothetical protein
MLHTNSLRSEPRLRLDLGAARPVVISEGAMDETIAESFPASDPPAWNPGLARPIPASVTRHDAPAANRSPQVDTPITRGPGVIDVSQPRKTTRTAREVLVSIGAAVGVALLAPLAILAIGTPIAASIRGLLELVVWMFSAVPR